MDTKEFSVRFDIEYNNLMSDAAPGLTEFEKSVFLTKAQEEIVTGLYSGTLSGYGFEVTEQLRVYLSNLVSTYTGTTFSNTLTGLTNGSVFVSTPSDTLFVTYESAILTDDRLGNLSPTDASVIPVTQDVYYKIKDNPFKGPSKDRVLRLDVGNNTFELLSKYNISSYLMRYLRRPKPIILEDLDSGLTIWGYNTQTECELNPAVHSLIMQQAVKEAKITYEVGLNVDNNQ